MARPVLIKLFVYIVPIFFALGCGEGQGRNFENRDRLYVNRNKQKRSCWGDEKISFVKKEGQEFYDSLGIELKRILGIAFFTTGHNRLA